MKFIGTPNLYIRFANKMLRRATGKKGFMFDENGEFETDSELLIRVLKQRFQVKETTEEDKIENSVVRRCKKCDFTCDSQGLLLRHYREEHPKEAKK